MADHGSHQIKFDDTRNLVIIRLGGLFSPAGIDRYIADLRHGFLQHRFRAGYLMLIDTTSCTIQPQEVLSHLAHHMVSFPKAKRIAIVNGDSLARMQVRRLMTQPYARIVETPLEGHRWLLSGIEPASAERDKVAAAG